MIYTKSIQIIPENLCLITDLDEDLNNEVMSALSDAINKSVEQTEEKITDNKN